MPCSKAPGPTSKTPPIPPWTPNCGELPLDLIHRGRYQPRRDMDEDALQELSDSIKQQGVMQPVVVRPWITVNTNWLPANAAGAPPRWPALIASRP